MNRLGTKYELAEALSLTVRRVEQLDAAGVFVAGPDERYDIAAETDRYTALSDKNIDWVCEELGRLGRAIDAGMEKMEATPDLVARRKLAPDVLPLTTQLFANLCLAGELEPPSLRKFCFDHARMVFALTFNRIFELCRWRLVDDEVTSAAAARGRNPKKKRR